MENINFENKKYEEDTNMGNEGLGMGAVGGLVVGGLAGYALSQNNRGWNNDGNGGCCNAGGGAYSIADVSNIVATKDAQYSQLAATSSSETAVIDRIDRVSIDLCKGLSALAADLTNQNTNARIEAMRDNAVTNERISAASTEAALCCCRTQALVRETALQSRNEYLTDQLAEERLARHARCNDEKINIVVNTVNQVANALGGVITQMNAKKVA